MITFTVMVVERVGRRKGLVWGAALGCIPMLYIGGYVMRADPEAAVAAGRVDRDGVSDLMGEKGTERMWPPRAMSLSSLNLILDGERHANLLLIESSGPTFPLCASTSTLS